MVLGCLCGVVWLWYGVVPLRVVSHVDGDMHHCRMWDMGYGIWKVGVWLLVDIIMLR
jgi:hypothetical protein